MERSVITDGDIEINVILAGIGRGGGSGGSAVFFHLVPRNANSWTRNAADPAGVYSATAYAIDCVSMSGR
jgi:hypothetical protein